MQKYHSPFIPRLRSVSSACLSGAETDSGVCPWSAWEGLQPCAGWQICALRVGYLVAFGASEGPDMSQRYVSRSHSLSERKGVQHEGQCRGTHREPRGDSDAEQELIRHTLSYEQV